MTPETFFRNFDPRLPAKDFYVDCSEARGNELIGRQIVNAFSASETKQHMIFTGHVGCGKSSELFNIAEKLKQGKHGKQFYPIYIDCDQFLESRDVDIRDVFLAIVAGLGDTFRDKLRIELKDSYLAKRFGEFKSLMLSNVNIKDVEVPLGEAKATLELNKTAGDLRREVRQRLFPNAETLVGHINEVIEQARTKLVQQTDYDDLVFIVDSLDKIDKIESREEGELSHIAFFIDGANQLKTIRAHCIWTAPLRLVRSHGGDISQRYDDEPFVLPMIRTRLRDGSSCPIGVDKAKEIFQKRIREVEAESVIETEALEDIITYSGGHLRMLIQLVRYAGEYADLEFPIKREHSTKAINRIARTLQGTVRTEDWKIMVELEASQTKAWDVLREENRRLLEQLCVLEYVNGEGEGIGDDIQWYAVNPILKQLRPYKEAAENMP